MTLDSMGLTASLMKEIIWMAHKSLCVIFSYTQWFDGIILFTLVSKINLGSAYWNHAG